MQRIALTLAVCMLGGCSSWNYRPTMEADPPETGVDGIVYIIELGKAYQTVTTQESVMCNKFEPSFQEKDKHSYYRYSGKEASTAARFGCLAFKEIKGSEGQAMVANHLRAGFALSDLYCKTFFRRISSHSAKRGFMRNNANDVGAAVSAILGLTKVSSAVTGGVGAGFGLVDGVFRTYDQQFLISPNLDSLQTRVFTEQRAFAAKVWAKPPTDLFEASTLIADHANYCSYVGMKTLIDDSLAKSSDSSSPVDAVARFIVAKETVEKAVKAEEERRATVEKAKADAAAAQAKAEKDADAKAGAKANETATTTP